MIGCTPNHSGLYTMIKKEYERIVLQFYYYTTDEDS